MYRKEVYVNRKWFFQIVIKKNPKYNKTKIVVTHSSCNMNDYSQ